MSDDPTGGFKLVEEPRAPPSSDPTGGFKLVEEPRGLVAQTLRPFTDYPSAYTEVEQRHRGEMLESARGIFNAGTVAGKAWNALKTLGDAGMWVFTPVEAGVQTFLGDPTERVTGVSGLSRSISEAGSIGAQLLMDPLAATLKAGKAVAEAPAVKSVVKAISPTTLEGAKPMERIVRASAAELAQSTTQAIHDLDQFRSGVNRLPEAEQLDIQHRIEAGLQQATPELQPVADELRKQLDAWRDKVRSLGKGYLEAARENYMPHIYGNYQEWRSGLPPSAGHDPMQAELARGQSRSPIRGAGSFLRQRSFETLQEAIDAGLKPVSSNPIDVTLIKLREMQKFYHGTKMADEIKQSGMVKWVPLHEEPDAIAAGLDKLNDRVFQPRVYSEDQYGATTVGGWYAPKNVATIFNNYVSKGIAGDPLYDAVRGGSNLLTQSQLGLSGFHATFVARDMMISRLALGIQQLSRGELRGVGNVAASFSPSTVTRTLRRGTKLREAYLDPNGASPEMRKFVDALTAGGGRINMDAFYSASGSGSFVTAIRNGTFMKEVLDTYRNTPITGTVKLAARAIETVAAPLMEYMVPRAKLGVFYDMAGDWMRRNPNASVPELQAAMIKVWDSVDNRLGQMVYDNLFWHRTLKDASFLAIRATGWNLGTLRELGGGGVDAIKALHDIATGNSAEVTSRMAYTIAMPIMTSIQGAILTYLMTGQGPQQRLDYFFPPTGRVRSDGQPDRVIIPGYDKDVLEYNEAPLQTVLNKLAPIFETIQEIQHNRDYYGGVIYSQLAGDDPLKEYGKYILGQAIPFSIRGAMRLSTEGSSPLAQAMAFWGFVPAPASIAAPERGEQYNARMEIQAIKRRERERQQGMLR